MMNPETMSEQEVMEYLQNEERQREETRREQQAAFDEAMKELKDEIPVSASSKTLGTLLDELVKLLKETITVTTDDKMRMYFDSIRIYVEKAAKKEDEKRAWQDRL